MRLGTETGSVMNHLQSRMVKGQPEPKAGMGVTLLHWTDRSAGTIFRVFSVGKTVLIEVRDDIATRADKNGMSESQDYEFKTNINGARSFFRREADGKWTKVALNPDTKRWAKSSGCGLRIGARDHYHDFSF